MASFPIFETAFTGVSVIRKNPMAFAIWLGAFVLLGVGFGALIFTQMSPLMANVLASQRAGTPDPMASLVMMQHMLPINSVVFLGSLVVYPVMYAAMARSVLRPTESQFGFLRLGSDEILQLVLMILIFAIGLGAEIAFFFGAAIIAAIVFLLLSSLGSAGAAAAGITGALAVIAILVALVIIAARLCLASAMTFDTGKISLFASWSLTKGKTWSVVAVGLVCAALTMVIYIVWGVAFAVIIGALALSAPGAMTDPAAVVRLFTSPAILMFQVVSAPVAAFLVPLWLTPPVEIYRRLARPEGVADVF
jgi:hypothetical protein